MFFYLNSKITSINIWMTYLLKYFHIYFLINFEYHKVWKLKYLDFPIQKWIIVINLSKLLIGCISQFKAPIN